MLESLVATVLNRTLGEYVENFDPNQLNIGIWSGDVKLKDLKLKEESLDKLGLPIALKFGHLGELTLQIPWSNIKSKPVKIIIENVYVLARAKLPTEFDLDAENARKQQEKMNKLDTLEVVENADSDQQSSPDDQQNESFMESLVTKIVDNLQITIKNIHFRYEDDDAFTSVPYAVGFTLEELSGISTSFDWSPQFIVSATTMIRKLLTLQSFSLYWDTSSSTIWDEDRQNVLDSFQSIIDDTIEDSSSVQFILQPVSGYGHLAVNKRGSTEEAPHYSIDLFFQQFGLVLDSTQYRDILWTVSQVTSYRKTYKFRKLRPKASVSEDPKAWLSYSFHCVYDEIRERDYKWTWEYFKNRRDQRKEYLPLWKAHLHTTETEDQKKRRAELEEELSFDDLKFYRELARVEYTKQYNAKPPSEKQVQAAAQPQGFGGLISSFFGGAAPAPAPVATTTDDDNEDFAMSEKQRQELYDAIDFDESKQLADSLDIPRDRVKVSVGWNLLRGSFSIKQSPNDANDMAGVFFEGLHMDMFQRKDSYFVGLKLREFRIEDGSDKTLFKHIVSVKPFSDSIQEVGNDPDSHDHASNDGTPFFQLSYEQNPLDGTADSEVLAKMKSLTIFHNPRFIQDLVRFFKAPKAASDTVATLMNAAESKIEDFTKQTKIGLQYAVDEHKTINCKMDLQAPLIIMPIDCNSWNSPVAILDSGHISVVSDLVDKATIKKISDEDKSSYTEEDWAKLNNFLFDKFNLVLQDTQMLIGPNIKAAIEQLHSKGNKPSLVLDHLTIKVLLEVSIIQKYYQLPLVKISGDIPKIVAVLNDYQYRIFMKMLETMIPNFEDDEYTDASNIPPGSAKENEELKKIVSNEEYHSGKEISLPTPEVEPVSPEVQDMVDKQHKFDLNINIGIIVASISRCYNPDTFESDKLADVVGENLRLSMFMNAVDMRINAVLADLTVNDYMETTNNEEFKKLISSKLPADELTDDHEDLFHLVYERKTRMAQLKGELIECNDQYIDLNISDFKIVVTRRSALTLISFLQNTFTDPNAEEAPADKLRHNEDSDDNAPQRIDINANLRSMTLVLNDDGSKLATLKLQKALVGILLLPERMKISAKLGGLSMRDNLPNALPALRQLVKVQGDELVEFGYETFDPSTPSSSFDSALTFHTGSIVITFVEGAFRRIYTFMNQFLAMKDVYDRARQTAMHQASGIEVPTQMKFDILIRTPIFIFPSIKNASAGIIDTVKMNLGQIEASNILTEKNGKQFNIMSAVLKNTRVSTNFALDNGHVQRFVIVDRFDIDIKVNHYLGTDLDRPATIVTGGITGDRMKLTEWQANALLQIAQSIPRAFADETISQQSMEDLEVDAENANMIISREMSPEKSTDALVTPISGEQNMSNVLDDDTVTLDVDFRIPVIALTLYNVTKNATSLEGQEVSQFSLNDIGVQYAMEKSGNFKADVHVKSLLINDERKGTDNKFPDIIPTSPNVDYQFMASAKSTGPEAKRSTNVEVVVDSPRVILAMDYLFALKSFADAAMQQPPQPANVETGLTTIREEDEPNAMSSHAGSRRQSMASIANPPAAASPAVKLSLNVVDPSIILLADPSKENSDAIVFKLGQLVAHSSGDIDLSADALGMFLCRMDKYDTSRLRVVDDFSVAFSVDTRGSTPTSFLTTISAEIDRMLLRVSLRDVNLALDIFNKANAMYSEAAKKAANDAKLREEPKRRRASISEEIGKTISKYAPSVGSTVSRKSVVLPPTVIVKAEKFSARIGGIRVVLIGDVHELPIVDLDVKPFEVTAKDWSTDLTLDVSIRTLINIYNYSTSCWEPLIEPWSFSFHVEQITLPKPHFVVNVTSRECAELTLTSRTIATLSHFASLLNDTSDVKPRGNDAPYRIINNTGYDLNIFIDNNNSEAKKQSTTLVKEGETIPWAFEDWKKTREDLSMVDSPKYIGVEFIDSKYKNVRRISLRTEGEDVFMLDPSIDGKYHNRLACKIVLTDDKVKQVVLMSTLVIYNHTTSNLLVGIGNYNGDFVVDRQIHIKAQEKMALPIDYVYEGQLAVMPENTRSQFGWSTAKILGTARPTKFNWKSIMANDMSLECPLIGEGKAKRFNLRAQAHSSEEALSKLYPHMVINISSPLIIENLLPFDISWKVFQKGSSRWEATLKEGDSSAVHIVDMNQSAVLKITVLGSKYGESQPAIINNPSSNGSVDKRITMRSENGQRLHLGLLYTDIEDSGTRITIISPYLVVNRTGETLYMSDNGNTLVSESQRMGTDLQKATPDLFSFENESQKGGIFGGNFENHATIRIGDSLSSSSFNIDKVGQSFEVKVPLKNRVLENDIGVHTTEGLGKYRFTKVVTVAPRYIVKNNLDLPIYVKSLGTTEPLYIKSNTVSPIYNVSKSANKQISLGFGDTAGWSAPFLIKNIGENYVRVKRADSASHMLLRAVISIKAATIFIDIIDAKNQWPYSLRNFSDYEFLIYQSDPSIDKDGHRTSRAPFKPIFYKVPAKSVMPYAWDYPAAEIKELVLRCGNRERFIQLAEIGFLFPMKVPNKDRSKKEPGIVDLNVVADGPVQSLVISNYDASTSLYQLKSARTGDGKLNSSSSSAISSGDDFEANVKTEDYYLTVLLDFEGMGLSLVNEACEEISYITMRGLELHYNESEILQNVSMRLKWLQADNQLYPAVFPIILYPSVVPKSRKEMDDHPTFSGGVSRLKGDSHGVTFIKLATTLLQEMSIEIDEDMLFALLDFSRIPGASWSVGSRDHLWDQQVSIPNPPDVRTTDDLYFELLNLQPMQFNVSFERTDSGDDEDDGGKKSNNAVKLAVNVLTMAIGNVNDAPIKLSALILENVRTPLPYLQQNVEEHYKQAFLYQWYKILGSADVLGNPVGLFNNVSSGVMDIFYEPYQGYIMTDRPEELGIGLAKGGLSFLKKSVFGVSDSVSRFTSSIAKGLSTASMDKNYQQKRKQQRRKNKPSHPINGLATGATSFVEGLSSGLTGLATAPIQGAEKNGAVGFLTGIGKGLIGFPTKTATGLLDFANDVSEGIKNTTTTFDTNGLDRVRLPRNVSYDGVVTPYSEREAQGQYWLKTCEGGKYANDKYLSHVMLQGNDHACIVSMSRILIVAIATLTFDWVLAYEKAGNIALENTGIQIKPKDPSQPTRFIAVPDQSDRRYLYHSIAVAVDAYNKRCIVSL